jgi:hypothetical protein
MSHESTENPWQPAPDGPFPTPPLDDTQTGDLTPPIETRDD